VNANDTPSASESSNAQDIGASPGSTTYCMGYWKIPGNIKHPVDHYIALMPRTIEMLRGERLLLFTDDESIRELVRNCCTRSMVTLTCLTRHVLDLPTHEYANRILQQTAAFGSSAERPENFNREKGLLHYWRDYLGSGPAVYQNVLAIWLSKVFLGHEVAQQNPFGSSHFAWIDASISRMNYQRANWNFVTLASPRRVISHYGGLMRKAGRLLSMSASFLKGDQDAWSSLITLYRNELSRAIHETYPNDEETILHSVKEKHADALLTIDASQR
jgi:hypothetical protein